MKPIRSLVLVFVVAGLVACSGSDNANPEVTAPLPATAPTIGADTTTLPPPTTDGDTTTTESSDTTTTGVESVGFLPADFGTPVDGAPGVDTPGEIVELIDGVHLFVPSEPDPDDASVVVPLPEDSDIIAAYGRAMIALYGQVTQNPIPVEPSEAMRATFVDGGAKYSENVFAVRSAAGVYLGFPGDGDVLRPVVIADPRSETEAFIFDCAISGSHYLKADGTLAAGEVGGTTRAPLIVRLVNQDGVWLVDDIQDDVRACS